MSLVETRNNLGDLYFTTGRHADAEAQYRAAVVLCEALESTATAAALGSLAENRVSLALLLQTTGRPKESAAEYAAAQTVLAKLVADHPNQPRYAVSLASCYVNRALLARAAERPEGALPWCDKALTVLGPVRARVPAHADARATEKNAHGVKAQVLESLGRYAEAIPDWDRVVELGLPQNRPVSRFLRAATLAKAGNHRRAVAEIEAIADEPRWGPAECYDLARVVAAALGAADRDDQLAPAERERLTTDYAARTAGLLIRAKPAGLWARWGFLARWCADAEFAPFLRRPECQPIVAGMMSLR
jgi:tetratricopeptide (TPR) repeat protein